jgi:hypothetical protein
VNIADNCPFQLTARLGGSKFRKPAGRFYPPMLVIQ